MSKHVPKIVPGDWNAVAHAIAKLDIELNTGATPTFAGLILSGLTASRLAATDASKVLTSVADLTTWITGITNQVVVVDDNDGTITLSLPQDIHTGASPTFAGLTLTDKLEVSGSIKGSELTFPPRKRQPLITFIFDDGPDEDYILIKPVFDNQNEVACSAVITDYIDNANNLSEAQLVEMQGDGWEIISHTVTHPDLTTLNEAQITTELVDSKSILEGMGLVINNFAYPGALHNALVRRITRKYYRSARIITTGLNLHILDTYRLNANSIEDHTQLATYQGYVDDCEAEEKWLILFTHNATATQDDADMMNTLIDYIQGKGIQIVTINQALDLIGNFIDGGDEFAIGEAGIWANSLIISNDSYIGSISDPDAIQIEADGTVNLSSNLIVDSPTLVVDAVNHTVGVNVAITDETFQVNGTTFLKGNVGIGQNSAGVFTLLLTSNTFATMAVAGGSAADFRYKDTGAAEDEKELLQRTQSGATAWSSLTDAGSFNKRYILVMNHMSGRIGIGEIAPETLIEMTDTTPYLTLHNSTEENSDGGRESRINFKGEQGTPSAGTETTLARIEVSHDGVADDEKGKFVISVNDGDDGDMPTDRFKIDAAGITYIGDGTNETQFSATGDVIFKGSSGLAFAEINVVSNAVETAITSAGAAVQITIFNTNGPANNVTPDHTNDHITITKAGIYLITVSSTVNSVTGAASRLEMTVLKNNGAALVGALHCDRDVGGGGSESGSVSISGLADLSVDDTIEVWIENETNTQNYIVEDITLTLVQVGGN